MTHFQQLADRMAQQAAADALAKKKKAADKVVDKDDKLRKEASVKPSKPDKAEKHEKKEKVDTKKDKTSAVAPPSI